MGPFREVEGLRHDHDPGAKLGIPAHITLLYPFAPPELAMSQIDDLATLFQRIACFDFALIEVRRFPTTAYLHPDKSELFAHMTVTIVARWPQYPPFGGQFPEVIPHLTVADRATVDVLNQVEEALKDRLPVRCHAAQAWLMCSDEEGLWRKVRSFDFKRSSTCEPVAGTLPFTAGLFLRATPSPPEFDAATATMRPTDDRAGRYPDRQRFRAWRASSPF